MAIELKFEEKAWWVAVAWGIALAAVLSVAAEYGYPNLQQKRKDIEGAKAQLTSLTAEIEKGRAAERKLSQFREEVKNSTSSSRSFFRCCLRNGTPKI